MFRSPGYGFYISWADVSAKSLIFLLIESNFPHTLDDKNRGTKVVTYRSRIEGQSKKVVA
jgi:hypothetical protein